MQTGGVVGEWKLHKPTGAVGWSIVQNSISPLHQAVLRFRFLLCDHRPEVAQTGGGHGGLLGAGGADHVARDNGGHVGVTEVKEPPVV